MTSGRRNLFIIALVVGLLAASVIAIVERPTRLGLDLSGGVELVYEAQPTPQVPEVTPEAIEDAITTIRERTDALGVSEPEIQQAGANQISVALPDVENAEEAVEQVGTTAQLAFYDYEPNIFTSEGDLQTLGDVQDSGQVAAPGLTRPLDLFEAVERAADAEPVPEPEDIPPGGVVEAELPDDVSPDDERAVQEFYDRENDSQSSDQYYLFDPDDELIAGPSASCADLLEEFGEADAATGAARQVPEGSGCGEELQGVSTEEVPSGSQALIVPRGILVVQAEAPENFPAGTPFEMYQIIEDDVELSGDDVRNPEQAFDPQTNQPIVTFEFSDEGQQAFARVTQRIADRGASQLRPPNTPPDATFQRFAITLDDELISVATIDYLENPEGIDGRTGASIEGIGSLEETQQLAESLRIGALAIELELISNTQVSATLGQQALDQGVIAGLAGLALTLLFLILFYRVLGLVAAMALVIYAVLLFALVELIPITLTLPGIAGMILTLGVAADANIVIFERIKEEARSGRSVPSAITAGYGKALRTIIDANVVTIGVAFILFMLATAGVKGFAFTLGVGVIVSLFTAVLATSAILGSIGRSRLLRSRHALGAGGSERSRWRFDFMGASRAVFSGSGIVIAAGALAIAGLGLTFGIDFESGTQITTPLEQPAEASEVRAALPPEFSDASVQAVEGTELGENVVQISVPELAPDQQEQVREALDQEFGVDPADFSTSSIGPTFGAQIAQTAVIAIIASLLLISLYIGIRFEFKYAVPVLIAIAHDLLITAGVYALTEREVTSSTVAALLTILGYSLYDTIIVFDRIRENVPRMPRATFSQIVNRSMSEVLTRSLVTSFSTLLPITALMLFGGTTLQDFGFALLIGTISGTYSSIFIASPVLSLWKEREPVYRRRRRLQMEEHGGAVPAFADGPKTPADDDPEPEQTGADGGAGGRRGRRQRARSAGAERQRLGRAGREPPPGDGSVAVDEAQDGRSGNGGPDGAERSDGEADGVGQPGASQPSTDPTLSGSRGPRNGGGQARRRRKHGRR